MDGSEWGVQQDDDPHPAHEVCRIHLGRLGGVSVPGDDTVIPHDLGDCRGTGLCYDCPFRQIEIRG